jgi:hypothetical protein
LTGGRFVERLVVMDSLGAHNHLESGIPIGKLRPRERLAEKGLAEDTETIREPGVAAGDDAAGE